MNARYVAPTVLLALLSGCDHKCSSATSDCMEEEITTFAPDEQTPLGFTARELAASIQGRYRGSLTWLPSSDVSMTVSGETSAELVLSCDGIGARLVGSGPGRLELDCNATMISDDGGLSETVAALAATEPGDAPRLGYANVSISLDQSKMVGTFRASSTTPGFSTKYTSWFLELREGDLTGCLSLSSERKLEDGVESFSTPCGELVGERADPPM